MKKLVVLLLSMSLCLGLIAGCAPQQTPTTSGSAPTSIPTQPTEPSTQPTEPPTQPTEPPTQPTEPPTQPTEPAGPEYEEVVSSPDFMGALAAAGGEKAKLAEDLTIGKFTFGKGCYFESSNTSYFDNGNVNTQKKPITIVLSGTVNSIKFDARGASSGSDCVLTLYKEGVAEPIFVSQGISNGTLVEGITIENLEPGTYILESSASARIGDFFVIERLEKAEPVSLAVTATVTDFLIGRELTAEGLTVELVYGNGRRDVLDAADYTTNLDKVENTTGVHTVTVTHTETGFEASYEIVIYAVKAVELSDYSLDASRVTHAVQKIYIKGDSYDNFDNIAVIATCAAPGVEEEKTFVLRQGEYEFDIALLTFDDLSVTPTNDTPSVIATVNTAIQHPAISTVIQASFDITILELSENVSNTCIIVDKNAMAGEGADGIVTVNSLNDALWLLKLLDAPRDARKTITLCPGTYFEKVDISIPNLSIVAKEGCKAEDIVVVFDALNGLMDPSLTTGYSTDGSATFSLRAGAEGFYGKGFTIMNYYNTHALYEQSKTIAGGGTQAVACLVRADKVIFEDMRFSSYHDTLYAENGRHIFRNCYIEGRTDYIFGNNATAYFTGCTIRSLGAGVTDKNGGYVVATKGGKSGQSVEYGYIFDGCTFEGDEDVRPGSVSIARGWGDYMTIMVMNCQLDGSFSKEFYGDTSSELNDRYGKMNAAPVAAQLFEYNNTGDGALTEYDAAVSQTIENLCTIPSADRAADFADFSKIFAATNGSFQYEDGWDGTHH